MGKPLRIDWAAIKDRWGAEALAPHLFVLPKGFAQMVLAIHERLIWEATYRVEGYDPADFDEIQTVVADGLGGLTDSVNLQTLLNYLDEVEPLLRAIRDRPCCGDSGPIYNPEVDPNQQSQIEDGIGDPPADYGSTPIATWQDWEDYKCEASWWAAENIALVLEGLGDMGELISQTPEGLTPDMIGEYLGSIPALGSVLQVTWNLVYGLLALTWDSFLDLDTAAGEVRAAANDIACAIFNADGPDAAAAAMKAEVQAVVTGVLPSAVVAFLPYETYANMVYEGEFVNRDGDTVYLDQVLTPQTSDCSCVVAPDYSWNWGSAEDGWAGWTQWVHGELDATRLRINDTSQPAAEITIPVPAGATQLRIVQSISVSTTAGGTYNMGFRIVQNGDTQTYPKAGDGTGLESELLFDVSAFAGGSITLHVLRTSGSNTYTSNWNWAEAYFS